MAQENRKTRRESSSEQHEQQKIYRCIGKTKGEFARSLVALSKEKPVSKITVKEVCDRAQLSRNAFYFHYADIDALISDIRDTLLSKFGHMFNAYRSEGFPDNMYSVVAGITELFEENSDATVMLVNCSPAFMNELNRLYGDFFFEYYKVYHHTETRELYDMFYSYLSNGFYGMYRYWQHHRDTIPKPLFIHLAFNFAKRLVALDNPDLTPLNRS